MESNIGIVDYGILSDDPPDLAQAKRDHYELFSPDDNFYPYQWMLEDFEITIRKLELPEGTSVPEPENPGWEWDAEYKKWFTTSYEKPIGASIAWSGYECLWMKHILDVGIQSPSEAEYGLEKLGEYYSNEAGCAYKLRRKLLN